MPPSPAGHFLLSFVSLALLRIAAAAQDAPATRPDELRPLLDRSLAQMRAASAVEGRKTRFFLVKGKSVAPAVEAPEPEQFHAARGRGWRTATAEREARSDGKTLWTIERGRRRYIRQEDFWTMDFGRHSLAGLEAVLAADTKLPAELRLEAATFDERACVAVRFALPKAGFDRVVYIDRATLWPAGYDQVQKDGLHVGVVYRDVRAVAALPASAFAWQPEEHFVEINTTKQREAAAPGTELPDAPVSLLQGNAASETTLSRLLAGKRALLVDFWFVDCPPCRKAMPVVADLASRLRDQGLELVTVNFGDSAEKIGRHLEREKLAVPVARNGVGPGDLVEVFAVPSFPSLFLIAPDRKVLWCEVGFHRASLESALRAAGFDLGK